MFAEYIRGIIFFLIFASFAGIILPEGKYKSYINIVIGFVVMFLVFEPVSGLDGVVLEMSRRLSDISAEGGEQYHELIDETVKKQIREQMSLAAEEYGYSLTDLAADIDFETGEVISMEITLTGKADSSGAIRIEPVRISEAEASDIKKIVSDFYRLPEEHIHVTIR